MAQYFVFVGVTTGESSIVRIFPRWKQRLGLDEDAEVLGVDLPIHAPTAAYREVVQRIKTDQRYLGALVTTHKLDLYDACSDLFDQLDRFACLCKEVSCIAHRGGRLMGWAKDPITAGKATKVSGIPAEAPV